MKNNLSCSCENCRRLNTSVEIETITIQHHVAQLCLACAHVLSLPKNEARFLQLVRKKDVHESNKEMQKAHQLLARFLAVGIFFLVIIAAAGISQGFDLTVLTSQEQNYENTAEYVSFIEINNYH